MGPDGDRNDESLWLWAGGALLGLVAVAAGVSGSYAAGNPDYNFWVSPGTVIAYGAFVAACLCLVAAVRRVRFPLSPRPHPGDGATETPTADGSDQARTELGLLLSRGNRLLWEVRMAGEFRIRGRLNIGGTDYVPRTVEALIPDVIDWRREATEALRRYVGWDAGELFKSDVGVPDGPCPFDASEAEQEADYYRHVYCRVWRLQHLMERLR